jgi:hypothetical protein
MSAEGDQEEQHEAALERRSPVTRPDPPAAEETVMDSLPIGEYAMLSDCVEVATAEAVLVRDTTDRNGPVVKFPAHAWRATPRSVCSSPVTDLQILLASGCRCTGSRWLFRRLVG